MQSTFAGLELGKRSVFAHQSALQTLGHNLSNAGTEGYSRQRVDMQTVPAIARPQFNRPGTAGQIGQGVEAARVGRARDELLDRRIISATGEQSYWETREGYLLQLEQVYNEVGDSGVRSLMDRFWDSWQELSLFPDQTATREAVVQRAQALTEGISLRAVSLDRIGRILDDEIRGTVTQANGLISEITDVNREIVQVRAAGDEPNDLLDRRDLLVERLAEHLDITIDDRDPNEFSIYTAGYHIVQGAIGRPFDVASSGAREGRADVTWVHSGAPVRLEGGRLGALMELRDGDLREEQQALDTLAVSISDLVNEAHRAGYGLDGARGDDFFVERYAVLDPQGNFDRDNDGVLDSTWLYRVSGTHQLDIQSQVGIDGVMRLPAPRRIAADGIVEVPYRATDTVEAIIERINNSGAEVVAGLNRDGAFTLRGTVAEDDDNPDFVIRHVEDSGLFLAGYAGLLAQPGDAGALRWETSDAITALRGASAGSDAATFSLAPLTRPAEWMEVNPDLVRDPRRIAAAEAPISGPGETGDGSTALAIASLRNSRVGVGRAETLDDFFADTVARIGLKGEQAEIALDTSEQITKDLTDMRQSISGVNIDEELADLIRFQQGYQAAARFISTITTMLDTILRLGA